MIIGLTGHTKGFGPLIKNYFESHGDIVHGFSRHNGYDITCASSRQQIITECAHMDLLINNANAADGQAQLLLEYYNEYGDAKRIVSIGTNITKHAVSSEYTDEHRNKTALLLVHQLYGAGEYISWGYHSDSKITHDYPCLLDSTTIAQALCQLYEICHNHQH